MTTAPAAILDILHARLLSEPRPSREMDARLHHALFPDQRVMLDPGVAFGPGEKRPAVYGTLADLPIDGWADWEAIAATVQADTYTASLDRAYDLAERVLPGALIKAEFTQDWSWVAIEGCEGACAGRRNPVAALLALIAALRKARATDAPDTPDGFGFPEELDNCPILDDAALVRRLRDEARSLGMLFQVDKAVMRAALVAALPDALRTRAVAGLGDDDPMFLRNPAAATTEDRLSAVDFVVDGAAALLDRVRVPPAGDQ